MEARCLISFFGVIIMFPGGVESSTESDAFQQAFLLVELLKAEYARVNKENFLLRARVTLTGEPTCPTTRLHENYNRSIIDGRRSAVMSRKLLFKNLTPGFEKNIRKHNFKSRRLDYDDIFGPHPGGDAATKQTESQGTTSSNPTTVTTTRSTVIILSTEKTAHTSTDLTTQLQQRIKKENVVKKKMSHKKRPTSRDPVMEQVASEIVNEMERNTKMKLPFYSAPLLTAKTERYTRFQKVKGTFRVHQATSKRCPIPLPENNAFCFHHPESALCRTLV